EKTTDHALVFVDSPVDALAYHQANGTKDARYLAVGSRIEPRQRALLLGALKNAPSKARLVLAFAATPTGEALAARVKAMARTRKFERHVPERSKSWVAFVERQERDWIRSQ